MGFMGVRERISTAGAQIASSPGIWFLSWMETIQLISGEETPECSRLLHIDDPFCFVPSNSVDFRDVDYFPGPGSYSFPEIYFSPVDFY